LNGGNFRRSTFCRLIDYFGLDIADMGRSIYGFHHGQSCTSNKDS
jgi:hypothetical protein